MHAAARERFADHGFGVAPDFRGVVLDPARLRIDLPVLTLRDGDDRAWLIEHHEAAARGALVDRADVLAHRSCNLRARPTAERARGGTDTRRAYAIGAITTTSASRIQQREPPHALQLREIGHRAHRDEREHEQHRAHRALQTRRARRRASPRARATRRDRDVRRATPRNSRSRTSGSETRSPIGPTVTAPARFSTFVDPDQREHERPDADEHVDPDLREQRRCQDPTRLPLLARRAADAARS